MSYKTRIENTYQAYLRNPQMQKYHCAGVYAIAIYGQIVYVGESTNILHRMAEHYVYTQSKEDEEHNKTREHKYEILFQSSKRKIKYVFWKLYQASSTHPVDLEDELKRLERHYINKYYPALNYQIPDAKDYHKYTVQKSAKTITLDELLEEINKRNRGVTAIEIYNEKIAKELLEPVLKDKCDVDAMLAQLKNKNFADEWEAKTNIHSPYDLGYNIGQKTAEAVFKHGMSKLLVAAVLNGHRTYPNAEYIKERAIYMSYTSGKTYCPIGRNPYHFVLMQDGYQRGFCDALSCLLCKSKMYSSSIERVLEETPKITDKDFRKTYFKYAF